MSTKKHIARILVLNLLCATVFLQMPACKGTPKPNGKSSSSETLSTDAESAGGTDASSGEGLEGETSGADSSRGVSSRGVSSVAPSSSTASKVVADDNIIRKYVTLFYTNKRPEEVEPYLREMEYLHGKIDSSSDRMYAFGLVGPMLLTQSTEEMADVINSGFDYAERYNIPVYFQLDDCNNYTTYFGSGAKIKYWEDPSMCEWIAFPQAGETYGGQKAYGKLPRNWNNWGGWRSIKAFPNLASPSFRKMVTDNLKTGVLNPLMARYNKLKEQGKAYLFAGMAVGWETQIPDYSPRNTLHSLDKRNLPRCVVTGEQMQVWEVAQYGYGALHALGYDQVKLDKEAAQKGVASDEWMRQILYTVLHGYSELLSKTCFDAGVPRHKIFTHFVGQASVRNFQTTLCPPLWVAVNDYSTPGYTMVDTASPYDLPAIKAAIAKEDPNQRYFANAEGYTYNIETEQAATAYFKKMFENGALNVTAFGYADPPTQYFSFYRTLDFGYNVALRNWLAHKF